MRWAMIGRSPGNGHPYSWSAICNGYNPVEMHKLCEFKTIPAYLDAAPRDEFGVGDVRVTHIWMPDRREAEFCARCSLIANVVRQPEDVIGEVDAVVIATDAGETHWEAAQPFLRAGLPVFLDKPLCLTIEDLERFQRVRDRGSRVSSCSSARFAREFIAAARDGQWGTIRSVHVTVPHRWETYGIHGVESLIHFLGTRARKVATLGAQDRSITAIEYADGGVGTVTCAEGGYPGLWLEIDGSASNAQVAWKDSFTSFRDTLRAFWRYVTSGEESFPFSETVDLMRIIARGLESREAGGACLAIEAVG